jgi:hypothetical protein
MFYNNLYFIPRGRRGRDRMVVGFTTTCAISSNHHLSCEFESRSWRGVLNTTLWDTFFSSFLWVLWFPPRIKLTATIWLKYCWVALSTIPLTLYFTPNTETGFSLMCCFNLRQPMYTSIMPLFTMNGMSNKMSLTGTTP